MEAEPQAPALDELLSHAAWVRALARSLVRDPEVADDVVQETWLAALTSPPKTRDNVRGWLAIVVRNAIRQRGRGGASRAAREERVAAERGDALPSSDELAERVETERRLAAQVLALDEPHRRLLLLRYFEGLSAAEIARRTDEPAGTVRWRISRALEELRDRLDHDFGGDRAAWMALLAPLAERDAALASAGAVSAGMLQGFLAMNLVSKAALVATIAVAGFFLMPLAGSLFDFAAGARRVDDTPLAVRFEPLDAASLEPAPVADAGAAEDERALASAPDPDARPEAVEPATGVRLRVLDPGGAPVAGVRARISYLRGSSARTAGDGYVTVRIPDGEVPLDLPGGVECDHPAFAPFETRCNLVADQVVELGDVVLTPAGAIEGRVLASDGGPVADAFIEYSADTTGSRADFDRRSVSLTADHWFEARGAKTDADGRFRLERVPAGLVRVWAAAPGHQASFSAPAEVRGGMLSAGVELSLGELQRDRFIVGRIVDPAGEPAPWAELEMRYRSRLRGSGSGSRSVDGEGRFALAYVPEVPRTLRARDRESRYAGAVAEEVEGGADVVLRLGEPELLELRVTSAAGGELEGATLWAFSPGRKSALVYGDQVRANGATYSLPIPAEEFYVEVLADGFEARELGPFDGLAAPRELAVELAPLPGVHGRVLANGRPVAGARIALHAAAIQRTTHNGFPVRVQPRPGATGATDEGGAFALTLRDACDLYVRAEADGLAPAEIGPLAYDPAAGLAGLELELTAGGVLEGRVLVPSGEQAAGRVVAVSRGDGYARTVRTDADGAYRFEHLAPGPWFARLTDEELSPYSSSTESDGSPFDEAAIASNCSIEEGATTRFDLDLGRGEVVVAVRLLLGGEPADGWTAHLIPSGRTMRAVTGPDERTDANGEVRLVAPSPGSYRLNLLDLGSRTLVTTELELIGGENPWHTELPTGTLIVEGAGATHASGLPLEYFVGRRGDVYTLVPCTTDDDDGTVRVEGVPALPGRIARFTVEELVGDVDPWTGGETLAEVPSFPAGGETRVRLP
ncbi:MAG: sigma-70 family RNA polymerase sigma factor [Planctomycetota bacterium]